MWDFCLSGLKWDHKTLIDDLAKMSKDRDYKPVFNPKSKEVLEKMNAEKRASLENESVTEEVKEQANQEAYSPMKKAANDDYDMGM
ncbi:DNA methyltransferase [Helicobacter pylori]|nr:DNA methyltransferase [Helicobacter pylori]